MRVIHARLSPLPVLLLLLLLLLLFCLYFVSACSSFGLSMPIFFIAFFKNEKFEQANSTVTHVCYK